MNRTVLSARLLNQAGLTGEMTPQEENPITNANLEVLIFVECPHCEDYIDLLKPEDTDGENHNDEANLTAQAFPTQAPWSESHKNFECVHVTCSGCKNQFDVKGLEW